MSELSVGQIKGLPVNSNVVTVPSGHTLYAPGHVINTYYVEMTATQTFTGTNSTLVDLSGLSVTVTPKSSSSKFLVSSTVFLANNLAGSRAINRGVLVRNSTQIAESVVNASASDNNSIIIAYPVAALDSPNTASPITYKTQGGQFATGGTVTVYVNRREFSDVLWAKSWLQVMEIAA